MNTSLAGFDGPYHLGRADARRAIRRLKRRNRFAFRPTALRLFAVGTGLPAIAAVAIAGKPAPTGAFN